jgi:hypothetical protein
MLTTGSRPYHIDDRAGSDKDGGSDTDSESVSFDLLVVFVESVSDGASAEKTSEDDFNEIAGHRAQNIFGKACHTVGDDGTARRENGGGLEAQKTNGKNRFSEILFHK